MKKSLLALPAVALFLIAGCQKPEYDTTDFTKITSRGIDGIPLGEVDPTDWRKSEEWTKREQKLFIDYDKFEHENDPSLPAEYFLFPNPTDGIATFQCYSGPDAYVNIRVVDEDFKTIVKSNKIGWGSVGLDLSSPTLKKSHVRLYYMVIRDNTCIAKGHGDIRIN